MRRLLAAFLSCFLIAIALPCFAFAAETGEAEFVSPTRRPGAPEYNKDAPWELQPEQIVAQSFILMERGSGYVLMNQNENNLMYPASTTKILTALVALKYAELDDIIEITESALNIPEDASRVPFKAGEEVTMRDALYGLLLKSGNEAANAIAEFVSGSIPAFVYLMNEEARELGCENTNFTNPHGYHDGVHQTTAKDLAIILNAAMDHEIFREIIGSLTYNLSATEKNPSRKITSTNLHLDPNQRTQEYDYYYPYSIGGKTGFTSDAGYVLVEVARQNNVELIAVVMYTGKYSRWADTRRLFEYGFTQYKSITPEEIYNENPLVVSIKGFETKDPKIGELDLALVPVDPSREVRITKLSPEVDAIIESFYDLYVDYRYTVELRAPITQGQKVGSLIFYPDNEDAVEYELIATRSIAARLDAPPTLDEIEQRVLADPWPFPPFSLDWVLPPVLVTFGILFGLRAILRFTFRKMRRRKRIPKPNRRYFN